MSAQHQAEIQGLKEELAGLTAALTSLTQAQSTPRPSLPPMPTQFAYAMPPQYVSQQQLPAQTQYWPTQAQDMRPTINNLHLQGAQGTTLTINRFSLQDGQGWPSGQGGQGVPWPSGQGTQGW